MRMKELECGIQAKIVLRNFADGHLLYFFPSFAENSLLFQTEYQVLILNMKQ